MNQIVKTNSYEEFINFSAPFLETFYHFSKSNNIEDVVIADHICYKCSTSEEFNALRTICETNQDCEYLYQVNLAGRRVAYFKFKNGLSKKYNQIRFFELADKKNILESPLGFHHLEIYPKSISLPTLIDLLKKNNNNIELKTRLHHTTYDVKLEKGFIIRITDKPLIKKIFEIEVGEK